MNEMTEIELKTSELAKRLQIAESTVRKYAQELEKAGYVFEKDSQGARIYRRHDFEAFSEMKEIRDNQKVGVDQAALMVASTQKGRANQAETPNNPQFVKNFHAAAIPKSLLEEYRAAFQQIATSDERIFDELHKIRAREEWLMHQVKELTTQNEELKQQVDSVNAKLDERLRLATINDRMSSVASARENRTKKRWLGLF